MQQEPLEQRGPTVLPESRARSALPGLKALPASKEFRVFREFRVLLDLSAQLDQPGQLAYKESLALLVQPDLPEPLVRQAQPAAKASRDCKVFKAQLVLPDPQEPLAMSRS